MPVTPPRIDLAGLEQGPVECHPASARFAVCMAALRQSGGRRIGREV
jgi:hypothetical protein